MTTAAEGEADTLPSIRLRRASVARFPPKGNRKGVEPRAQRKRASAVVIRREGDGLGALIRHPRCPGLVSGLTVKEKGKPPASPSVRAPQGVIAWGGRMPVGVSRGGVIRHRGSWVEGRTCSAFRFACVGCVILTVCACGGRLPVRVIVMRSPCGSVHPAGGPVARAWGGRRRSLAIRHGALGDEPA